MSNEYIFLVDWFLEDFSGGAEMVDDELIKVLVSAGNEVQKIKCADVTPEFVQQNSHKRFIVGNYMRLSRESKKELMKSCDYILYEHDHKYTINKNPAEYPDYLVPKRYIVNQDFYDNATGVVCQSKMHAEVLSKNLNIDTARSVGSSLWTQEFLDQISNIDITNKNGKAAIIESTNKIKNQQKSEEWCKSNKVPYEVISSPTPLGLVKKLAEFEHLVFFPGVLETFSRIVVEAKMVGCKLITKGGSRLIGCTGEEWFKEDRETIIKEMKLARQKTLTVIEELFGKKKDNPRSTGNITVILNSYRRPYNLKDQISAIRNQTVEPLQIWLWVNEHEDNKDFDHLAVGADRVFDNNHNWKFYGRFAAALLADTEYVAIFDDDTIPGKRWFENCLETMKSHEGILGSAGVILKTDNYYMTHVRCGWPSQNTETTPVDLVGHAWFFRREWLQYLWREKPFTWDNGEDIQFSYLAKKYGNIQTYCPPHPPDNLSLHGSIRGNELGIDDKATSNNNDTTHHQFFNERDLCIRNAVANGWELVDSWGQQKNFYNSFYNLLYKLESGENFAFTRFSDGELDIMQNYYVRLSEDTVQRGEEKLAVHPYPAEDHKEFDPDKHQESRQLLLEAYKHRQKNYYKGVSCPCCVPSHRVQEMIDLHGEGDDEHLIWANQLVNANYPRFVREMLPRFYNKKIVLVGNETLQWPPSDPQISKLFPLDVKQIFTVGYNCFANDLDKIKEISHYIETNNIEDHVFLFSAASLSEILIYKLFSKYPNNTYIDIGTTMHPILGLTVARDYLKAYWTGNQHPDMYKVCKFLGDQ